MTFIRATNNRLYPASRVLSVGAPETRRGEGITEIEVAGVGPVECYSHNVERFLRQPVTSFAAQPETYILRLDDDSPGGYWKTLVVGWGAAQDGYLYPITADGVNDADDNDHYILTPDGRVSQSENGSWETIEDFLKCEAKAALAA